MDFYHFNENNPKLYKIMQLVMGPKLEDFWAVFNFRQRKAGDKTEQTKHTKKVEKN